ncbi:MAG: biotin/lipoate A/B protein ligase family protein [Candidatus Hodarchaeota archaeon]
MEEWRLIDLEVLSGPMTMAIDEAILRLTALGRSPPTLRLYRWNPSTVSIGYFQSIHEEVDLEVCRELEVDVVRRITGGGAVYHDYDGEITYSMIVKEDNPKIPRNIMESYRLICQGIVGGIKNLGLNAEFKPINDIIANGRKISGNAQTRRQNVFLQHGTILVDFDPEAMFKVLKVSRAKISDKLIQSVRERVTSIRNELEGDITFEEVRKALIEGFQGVLQINFKKGKLSESEQELADRLLIDKYSDQGWNFRR